MKPRLFCLWLLLLAAVGLSAYDFKYGDLYYNITSDSTVEVTYQVYDSDNNYVGFISANIPASIEYAGKNYNVTSIGSDAFLLCRSLTSITIPNSVTSIGQQAFCVTGLTSITIPNSVTSFGENVFGGCSGLTSIIVENENPKYDSRNNCNAIIESASNTLIAGCKTTTIPNSVTSIGDLAFSGCSGLSSVTIGNSVTSIGDWAFFGCSGLSSITIPNSVTSIGDGAFQGCSGLTSITIPNSVTSIGDRAFSDCSGLTSIIVENENLKYDSRNNCNAIIETATSTLIAGCQNTIIPNSVTSIGGYAFQGCRGLTSITIGNSVTSIGKYAFSGCSGLTSVVWNAANYPDCQNGITPFYDLRLQITSFVFGDSVEHIPTYLCFGMSVLTSITIPNSVTSIGEYAFYNAYSIVYSGTATGAPWGARSMNGYTDGFLVYSDATKTSLLACSCAAKGTITIPNSVTSIGDYAFLGCASLTSITIPNSVTSIGDYAFSGCSGLTSVTIPNSVTSIRDYAFSGCSGLTSITIPNSVTSIGEYAFRGCSGLTSITIPNSVTSIGEYAFRGCSGLTSITIPNSVTSIGDDAFCGCSGLISITIPNSVTSIGGSAFSGCSGLTSITIPNSVTSIGDYAFYGCSGLTSITFLGRLPSHIGNWAFGYENCNIHKLVCKSYEMKLTDLTDLPFIKTLDTIVMPANGFDVSEESWATLPKYLKYAQLTSGEMTDNAFAVLNRSYKTLQTLDIQAVSNTSIADEAFKGCYNLRTLLLPSQLTKIPYMAVADCKSLQEITIPATVEEIDNSAFENCRSIQTITFAGADALQGIAQYAPASGCALHRIGNWAFYNCHELQHLTIPEGVTEIGDAAFYGCTYLQDLTLPASVEQIGDNCFALCSKLQKITVLSTTPPAIAAKTFYDVNRAIPVYVPAESVADYQGDTYWKEFNIQADTTPIDHTQADGTASATPHKVVRDGQVLIIRGDKTYTATGIEVR